MYQIAAVGLSPLSALDKVGAVPQQFCGVFSSKGMYLDHNGLISKDIPLLDDIPVCQHDFAMVYINKSLKGIT